MSVDQLLQDVTTTADATRAARDAHDDAQAAQKTAIRAALDGGARVVDVVAASGLSRERIYQIKDGRR